VPDSPVAESKSDELATPLRRHSDAIAAFTVRARTLSDLQWRTPRAVDKWTPAQEMMHLTLTCRVFAHALNTGEQIALCVSPERSRELYHAVVPRVLAGGWFPRGGTSPDVAMPTDTIPPSPRAISDLEAAARELDEAATAAFARDPAARTTHPYFGLMGLPELFSFLSAHVDHHRSHLLQRLDTDDA